MCVFVYTHIYIYIYIYTYIYRFRGVGSRWCQDSVGRPKDGTRLLQRSTRTDGPTGAHDSPIWLLDALRALTGRPLGLPRRPRLLQENTRTEQQGPTTVQFGS